MSEIVRWAASSAEIQIINVTYFSILAISNRESAFTVQAPSFIVIVLPDVSRLKQPAVSEVEHTAFIQVPAEVVVKL